MRFGRLPLDEALGAVIGHTLRLGAGGVIKKGRRLGEQELRALEAAGHAEVIAARLDEDDLAEDDAAARVAAAAGGGGTRVAAATTGRSNVYALADGLLRIDAARVNALNQVDESVTLATAAPDLPVRAGDMIATVKIIPYAVPRAVVEACEAAARGAYDGAAERALTVAPFRGFHAGLLLTRLAGVHESVLDRAAAAQRVRAERLGGSVAMELRCAHDEEEVAAAIRVLLGAGCSPLLLLGASAIADRRDVIPAGIERAGGVIEHFGMPVDPGNLLLLGRHAEVPLVGLPGCARSLQRSGFDMALERIAAGVGVKRSDLTAMGVGGLLVEPPARRPPPDPLDRQTGATPGEASGETPGEAPVSVAAVVLAAGHSRRMGERNKLLLPIDGEPMVARVVDAILATRARPVVVVTGHDADGVMAALHGRPVRFVHNPAHEAGMSGSLRAGIAALGPLGDDDHRDPEARRIEGALVCLGDMPRLQPRHLEALLAAFAPDWPGSPWPGDEPADEPALARPPGDPAGAAGALTSSELGPDREAARPLCVPTFEGHRGNPVLFARRYFHELCALEGDVGARAVVERHAADVRRVPVEDDGVLIDIDTPETLAAITQDQGS